MQTLSSNQIEQALEEARLNGRRRAIIKISSGPNEPMQLFGNALLRGTYAQPHRHSPRKDRDGVEHFIIIKGRVGVITFDDDGAVLRVVVLSTDGNQAVSIPANVWHTIVCLTPEAVVIEVKQGYYDGDTDKLFHDGFPSEGDPMVPGVVSSFEAICQAC